MENLDEKLYDYLNTQTEPKSIGEINGSTEFKDVPRRELAQMLQNLTAQRIAYRSLKQGKAYYSCKSSDGVDLNPAQRNIANVQEALNGAFNQKKQTDEEKVLSAFGDLMQSISVLSEELGVDDETPATSVDVFELTYNEGIKFENDKYSFTVPDGFVLATGDDMGSEGIMMSPDTENEEKRDFIAWLPDPRFPDSQEEAFIRILPSFESDMIALEYNVRNPEIYSTILKCQTIIAIDNIGMVGGFKMLEIPTNGEAYICQYAPDPDIDHYCVSFLPCKKRKQIRIDVKGVNKENQEKAHQMICELAHNFVSKDRPEPIKKLDDASYCGKVITEAIEKDWLENFNLHISEIDVLFKFKNLLVETLTKYDAQNRQYSSVKTKKEFRDNIEKAATQIEEVFAQANTFIKSVSSLNKGNRALMNIYLELIDIVEANQVIELNLDDVTLKAEVKNAADTLKIWKTSEIDELLNSNQAEIKKKKREEKRKEADSVLKKTDDFICEGRKAFQDIHKNWKKAVDENQSILSMKTYMSEYELICDFRELVRHRDEFGEIYDELIRQVDENGKILIENGGDYQTVKKIADFIDEIIDESSTIDLDFTATGTISGNIGNTKFSVSSKSKAYQKWWKEKYESMPEIQAEKKKKRLTFEVRNIEKSISDLEGKKDEFRRQERQLKDEIASLEKKIQEGEIGLESAKSSIIEKADQELKKQQLKIDEAVKAKSDGEKKLEELMKQKDGLSIFKRSLKKELTKQMEDLRGQIPTMISIREQEKVCEDIKRKRDFDVSTLQNTIDDNKSKLRQKNVELTQIPDQLKKNEQEIENEKAKLEKKKAELTEVEELL